MRALFYISSLLAVLGLAIWAYQENYRTQASLKEVERLSAEIAELRETLAVLNAEWSYLNRPERLRELADMNFDRLGLLPLRPDHFGRIDQVSFPAPPALPVTRAWDVSGTGGEEAAR
ncbi:MAG: cell division protein FtsL [Paracoccaceae bacterium]|nr:cell division protein FtsL [Paracoccaceae bacterium]